MNTNKKKFNEFFNWKKDETIKVMSAEQVLHGLYGTIETSVDLFKDGEDPVNALKFILSQITSLMRFTKKESLVVVILASAVYELSMVEAPDDIPDEKALAALDLSKKKFGELFEKHIKKATEIEDDHLQEIAIAIICMIARCVYLINQYQAPPRIDPAEALRDAMGQSDHCYEFIYGILYSIIPDKREIKD